MHLYDTLADWWPLISAPGDYAQEAAAYAGLLRSASATGTMLELGSGGGNNASFLKHEYRMTLVDASPRMLDVSRALNPECEHVHGDMRTVRLGRMFDAVFIHDAIMYMTTESDLFAAIETAALHCRPGGAVLVAPDCFLEDFRAEASTGGEDGNGRSARYLQWDYPDGPGGYIADFVFMLREHGQPARIVHDRHRFGLFAREKWLELFRRAGLTPTVHFPADSDGFLLHVVLGAKPA